LGVDLPRPSEHAVRAVMTWLQEEEPIMRPPVATAKFLVFCVILHDAGEPFPPRRDVAQHLGVSIPLIDTALSQRQGTKHISIRLEFTQGNVRRRVSTVRHRMIEPCEELIRLVHQAEAEDRAAGRSKPAPRRRERAAEGA
jgi:hypothetical protein